MELPEDPAEDDFLDSTLRELMKKPRFAAAMEDTETRRSILTELISLRKQILTASEVAKKMGWELWEVELLEGGATDPYLSTLQRYARALNKRLRVEIE